MKNKALIDLIDYLLEDYGGDCCAKCVYLQQADENGNIPPCRPFEQDGNIGCRNGMIAYFKQSTKKKKTEIKSFGEILKEKRKERGWSQTQLANKLGIADYKVVGRWEADKSDPKLIDFLCLADVFGCSLDELVGRE